MKLMKLSISLVLTSVLTALSAAAQPMVDANEVNASEGVVLPSPSITETRDATALAVNPANLGFLDAWNLVYVGSWLETAQRRLTGQGHGFFFALPVGPVGLGVGVEPLSPMTETVQWQGLGHRTRFSLGLGLNLKRVVGLGIAYRTFWFEQYGDIRTLDLGLSIHPMNYLAFSFVFSNINAPRFRYRYWMADTGIWSGIHNHRAPRRFNVGMTIRPLGNERLALGGEIRYLHGDSDDQLYADGTFSRTDIMAFLSGVPINGVTLKMRFLAEGIRDARQDTNLILDGTLALDLPNFGFGASVYGQVSPDGTTGYQGTSWFASFHGDVAPSLNLPRPLRSTHVVVLDLEDKMDSYDATRLAGVFQRIENDKSVDMVLFRPDSGSLGLNEAEEVREHLRRIRSTGREVACYLREATGPVYLACAQADHIWLNPAGALLFAGLKTHRLYFRDLFDKVGVKADMIRIGEYKDAPETYTRNTPSDPSLEQMNRYLDEVYVRVVSLVKRDRGLKDHNAVRKLIERGPFTPKEALAAGLVDGIVATDEIEEKFSELVSGHVFFDQEYHENRVRHRRYIDAPAVAVVHIDGDLVNGESREIPLLNIKMTGAKTITENLRKIARDTRIRAVILRINSGGGSAMAADIIWREVMALREEKPVIASLGAVAASGAYYIASAADEIYASPSSLTGSIGIFYGKADISELLDRVGVDTVTFKRGEMSDAQSWLRPYTDKERAKLETQLKQFYDLFLERVAAGRERGFTTQIVDRLGRGRIWAGTDAKKHLLIDYMGTYRHALDRARQLGYVPTDIPVFHFPPKRRSLVMRAMDSAMSMVRTRQENPLSFVLDASGMKDALGAVVPFAAVPAYSPRARLPFVLIQD